MGEHSNLTSLHYVLALWLQKFHLFLSISLQRSNTSSAEYYSRQWIYIRSHVISKQTSQQHNQPKIIIIIPNKRKPKTIVIFSITSFSKGNVQNLKHFEKEKKEALLSYFLYKTFAHENCFIFGVLFCLVYMTFAKWRQLNSLGQRHL